MIDPYKIEIKKVIEKCNEHFLDYQSKKGVFFRHLVSILLALLALLISLKGPVNNTPLNNNLFVVSVCLIVACILCSVSVLYIQITHAKAVYQDYRRLLLERLEGEGKKRDGYQFDRTDMPPYAIYIEKGALLFLILALISLVIYSYTLII